LSATAGRTSGCALLELDYGCRKALERQRLRSRQVRTMVGRSPKCGLAAHALALSLSVASIW